MDRNLEMLSRAKSYIELLAKGFDPISGEELPDDTVLNNVRLSRCFFFVSEVLGEVIENGGEEKRAPKHKLPDFSITAEEKARVELSDEPLQISKFCERINNVVDEEKAGRLKATAFGKWLVEKGYLEVEIRNDKNHKKASASGTAMGIVSEWRVYGNDNYYAITYSKKAQQFLLDNLDGIIEVSNGKA